MTSAVQKLRDIEADWMAMATRSAIEAAREVITSNNISGRAMVSSLSELEWGWICCAAIFAWIKTKSEQAVAEGRGYDGLIRAMPDRDPQPWDAGAVASILPALGELKGVDWDKPLSEWSKDQIISFAWQIHYLIDGAIARREEGATDKITQNLSQAVAERELNAKNGGPLMSRKELNDDVPF